MLKALTVTAVDMALSIWMVPINRDVCIVLAMVGQVVVNQPVDLLHQAFQVNLLMKLVCICTFSQIVLQRNPDFTIVDLTIFPIKRSTFCVPTKVTVHCMEQNPDLTIFGSTIFPV